MTGTSTRLRAWWDDYWFRPTTPTNLALCRVVFFSAAYWWLFIDADVRGVAELAAYPDVWYLPHGLFKFLPRIPGEMTLWMCQVLRGAILCAAFGLFTRVSCVVSSVLCLLVVSQFSMFGKIVYYTIPMVVTPAFFAISRSGDAFSIDQLIRRRWSGWPGLRTPLGRESGEYRWPVQFGCLYVAILFFGAGITKLLYAGIDWPFSETLHSILTADASSQACRLGAQWRFPDLTAWLLEREYRLHTVALLWLAIELASPLVLRRGWSRFLMILPLYASLLPSVLIGRIPSPIVMTFVFLVPWDRIGRALAQRWRGRTG